MRFGFCTGFATRPRFTLDVPLVGRIRRAGYDFPDFPVMAFDSATKATREQVREAMGDSVCPAACNLVPASLKLVGKEVDGGALAAYLSRVLSIMASFGVQHLVLGSARSRMLPSGMGCREGKAQFGNVLKEYLLPVVRSFGMDILLEPLNRVECNLLNTVEECALFVREVHQPDLMLMADLYHMEANGERPETLQDAMPLIHHLHIAGVGRSLPTDGFDPYLRACIRIAKASGYDETISYETVDGDIQGALALLKAMWS